jgi:hypothetical protein
VKRVTRGFFGSRNQDHQKFESGRAMNLVAAIQKMLPGPLRGSDVDAIVAAVIKPAALHNAECAMGENVALEASLTKRQREIAERLNFQSPLRTVLKVDHDALVAENVDINRQVIDLRNQARELRAQIAGLMPDYGRSVAKALAPFRVSVAEQLADAVVLAEQALADISESNKTLMAVGMSPPAAFALPYAAALKGLSDKILKERV